MLRAYQYLFYKLYRFERLLWDPAPEYTALGLLIFTQMMNIFSVICLIEWSVGRRLLGTLPKWYGIPFIAFLAVPQYLFLVHRRRFLNSAKMFRHETPSQEIIRGVIIGAYIVFSFCLLILSAGVVPKT